MMILEWVSSALIGVGVLFVFLGALGMLRFPDFYTRIHAAGVIDTLGAELVIVGLILQADSFLVAVKLAFIALFLFLTGPVATHGLAYVAWIGGVKPKLRQGLELRQRASAEQGDKNDG